MTPFAIITVYLHREYADRRVMAQHSHFAVALTPAKKHLLFELNLKISIRTELKKRFFKTELTKRFFEQNLKISKSKDNNEVKIMIIT